MEAPLAVRNGEEEEVMGMDLKTRRRSHHDHKLHTTSPKSSESSITSDSSDEDALDVENNRGTGASNGENSSILESGSVNEEAQVEAEPMVEAQKEENAEEPNKGEDEIVVDLNGVFFSTNEGTNGLSFHQNGHTIEYSLQESDVGSQDTTANSSSLSKSPDTAVGLKELESLLDESSNNLNFAAKDAYNALDDILTNAPKNVENKNETVHVILPKDLTPEIQEVDVEKEMQNHKHVLTLNNAPKSFENEIGYHHLYKDPLPEVEEFDVESVERVIQKQETHDLYCPNCNSCITKRVILKRRKRKIQEISPSEDIVDRCTLTQPSSLPTSDGILEGNQENVPASVDSAADEPIYAITCLSCFSIFLPTQNGWLRRIFGRKPEIPLQSDASTTQQLVPSLEVPEGGEASADANIDDSKGNVFPLWIINCCQPSREDKKPVRPDTPVATKQEPEPGRSDVPPKDILDDAGMGLQKPDTKPALTLPDVTEGLEDKIKPHLPVPDETLSSPKRKFHAKPEDMFALWFLNCCQPHKDEINRPHLAGKADASSLPKPEPVHDADVDASLPSKLTPSTQPDRDIRALHEPEPPTADKPLASATKPDSGAYLNPKPEPISDAGVDASLMPAKPLMTLDKDSASLPKPEPTPGQDILSPSKLISITPVGRTPLSPMPIHVASPDGYTSSPPKPTPPPTPDGAKTLPPELKPPMAPDDDIMLFTDRKPPLTPHTGRELTITMPNQEPSKPLSSPTILSVIQPVAGTLNDLESHLLDTSKGPATTGERAGVDIIKAIVYGGLLECITSLSVITSAAGGDATTLNIVALGLANVFAGLVLLFHNLRVLKREHGSERYTQQMGRPGHFCLHATVAVISYLIFGLMAPIIYGFCFRKSDNKDYKLITLAAASLVCITVLSTAKAYVRSPPKAYLQTVFYYIGVGFAVSGVGYVAGDLTNMLLKKLGVFDSRSAPPEAGDMKGIWASY